MILQRDVKGDLRRSRGLWALLLALSILCSSYFLSRGLHHACRQSHCPVCACLEQCRGLLRLTREALPFPGLFLAFLCPTLLVRAPSPSRERPTTLVLIKVRLDD